MKTNKPNKRMIVLLGILAVLVIAAVIVYITLPVRPKHSEKAEESTEELPETAKTSPDGVEVFYTDTMHFYHPPKENVSYDETEQFTFINNIVIAYLMRDLSEERREAIAKTINGELVGNCSGALNLIQIRVEPSDADELRQYACRLMELNDVMYASIDTPANVEENDSVTEDRNDWGGEQDKGNLDDPNGNDWWAEAIDAYTAWDYAEGYSRRTVGIVDLGSYPEHKDFEGNLTVLNTADTIVHGTHVAGLIGAVNNELGIRGVSDGSRMLCLDFTPDDQSVGSTTEFIALMAQLVQNGASVVNQSAGGVFYDREEYKNEGRNQNFDNYDAYVKFYTNDCRQSGEVVISVMTNMYLSGYEDYLVVQAAGNGYNNWNRVGIDSFYGGYYSCVDEKTYNQYLNQFDDMRRLTDTMAEEVVSDRVLQKIDTIEETVRDLGLSYYEDRIIVVGSVENRRDGDGNYYLYKGSNYNVDICAPGEDIYSTSTMSNSLIETLTEDDRLLTPDKMSTYEKLSGTSMAAPIVAGSAALLWACDPFLSPGEVKQYLTVNTEKVAKVKHPVIGEDSSYPMLNIGQSMKSVFPEEFLQYEISPYFNDNTEMLEYDWPLVEENGYPNLGFEESWEFDGFYYGYKGEKVFSSGHGYLLANGSNDEVTLYGTYLGDDYSALTKSLEADGWEYSKYYADPVPVTTPDGSTALLRKMFWHRGAGSDPYNENLFVATDEEDAIVYWWYTNEQMATMDDAADYYVLGYKYQEN